MTNVVVFSFPSGKRYDKLLTKFNAQVGFEPTSELPILQHYLGFEIACANKKISPAFPIDHFLYTVSYKPILMPCPFTGPKMFWAGTIFLCQTKNLSKYCVSHKHFVPDRKMICIQ